MLIRLPRPGGHGGRQRRSLLGDFRVGWDYLRQRPGLLSLLWVFAVTNFAVSIVQVLLTPLILSFGSATKPRVLEFARPSSPRTFAPPFSAFCPISSAS